MFEFKLENARSTQHLVNELATYLRSLSKDTLTPLKLEESANIVQILRACILTFNKDESKIDNSVTALLTRTANQLKAEGLIFTFSLIPNVVWEID